MQDKGVFITTYAKKARASRLLLSLRELDIDETTHYSIPNERDAADLFVQLTVLTPTYQSHLGRKFEAYSKLNNRSTEGFLGALFSGLGINNIFLYKTFESKTAQTYDLRNDVLSCKETMLCLRCDNGVLKSLYMSIRNAIAHGNIIEREGYIVFYSVSDDKKEYDSNITFFLRIRKQRNLSAFTKVLSLYE